VTRVPSENFRRCNSVPGVIAQCTFTYVRNFAPSKVSSIFPLEAHVPLLGGIFDWILQIPVKVDSIVMSFRPGSLNEMRDPQRWQNHG